MDKKVGKEDRKMLDTHCRKYVNSIIERTAKLFIYLGFSANKITILAFLVGMFTSVMIYCNTSIVACTLLWISGFLDSVDGAVARITKSSSSIGTLMDIVSDRVVEIGIILAIGIINYNVRLELIILTSTIVISMTVFLTVGALSVHKGVKSFYYQAGMMERTEGFIMFTLMILFPKYLSCIILIFALFIIITVFQRINEARKILN